MHANRMDSNILKVGKQGAVPHHIGSYLLIEFLEKMFFGRGFFIRPGL